MNTHLQHTLIINKSFSCPTLQCLHDEMRTLDDTWRKSKADKEPYENTKFLCSMFIDASYAFQTERWGRVRVKTNTASLMR